MNQKQEFTQEEIMERAKENSAVYFELLNDPNFIVTQVNYPEELEESFYW